MGNQQSAKEPKPNLSTLGAVSSIRSSRKPRVPKDSRIIGSNNIFTEHHGEFRDNRRFETDFSAIALDCAKTFSLHLHQRRAKMAQRFSFGASLAGLRLRLSRGNTGRIYGPDMCHKIT